MPAIPSIRPLAASFLTAGLGASLLPVAFPAPADAAPGMTRCCASIIKSSFRAPISSTTSPSRVARRDSYRQRPHGQPGLDHARRSSAFRSTASMFTPATAPATASSSAIPIIAAAAPFADIDFYPAAPFPETGFRQHLSVYDGALAIDGDGVRARLVAWTGAGRDRDSRGWRARNGASAHAALRADETSANYRKADRAAYAGGLRRAATRQPRNSSSTAAASRSRRNSAKANFCCKSAVADRDRRARRNGAGILNEIEAGAERSRQRRLTPS